VKLHEVLKRTKLPEVDDGSHADVAKVERQLLDDEEELARAVGNPVEGVVAVEAAEESRLVTSVGQALHEPFGFSFGCSDDDKQVILPVFKALDGEVQQKLHLGLLVGRTKIKECVGDHALREASKFRKKANKRHVGVQVGPKLVVVDDDVLDGLTGSDLLQKDETLNQVVLKLGRVLDGAEDVLVGLAEGLDVFVVEELDDFFQDFSRQCIKTRDVAGRNWNQSPVARCANLLSLAAGGLSNCRQHLGLRHGVEPTPRRHGSLAGLLVGVHC